ncbi:hypothetical protein [Streptomyces lannensis]|uniref:Helix-turn-helix domain-containing protein n=1 Tax=Streptomyces lannensis TaxID=766498 RepID=A0ABP7KQW9_9ACTN
MSGYGAAGIRRGAMAADRFTQIRNSLFRDPKISYRAKGVFGLISTHRDGWRVSVAELARQGPEGKDAVTVALKELERHGYLVRERERRADGTLGAASYFITDMPEPPARRPSPAPPPSTTPPATGKENRRSEPAPEKPAQAEPAQAFPPTKNTNRKKTTRQNTNPLRPSAPHTHRRENDDATATPPDGRKSPSRHTPAGEPSAGARLLLSIGVEHPELLLTGPALRDQGQVVTAMLETGWSLEQVRRIVASRPLPDRIRSSVDAIVAARLNTAHAYPPPATCPDTAPAARPSQTALADHRPVREALAYRALAECAGCGLPGCAPGENLCPACLNWPLCRCCTGPTPRRAHPEGDGRCATCATTFTSRPEGVSA